MEDLLEKRRSALPIPKTQREMTLATFLPSSVESCGGDHGISSREEEVWPWSPKKEKSMTMAIFLPA